MSAPIPDDLPNYLDMCEPEARIAQIGRWSYSIEIIHGLMSIGPNGLPWHRLGRKRAEAKARRELARYRREEVRRKTAWKVT